ncbi:MAG: hypothetical protein WBQ14_05870 [Gaiellaceae bacterium]
MKRLRTSKSRSNVALNDVSNELLAKASPITDTAIGAAGLTHAFEALAGNILAAESRSGRRAIGRPTRRFAVIGLGLVAMLAVAGLGLGGMITTHTGFFPEKPGTENDTSEYLRTDAPDFPPLVRKLVKDIPYPPGDSALSRVSLYVRRFQPGPDGIPNTVQAAGIKGQFSFWAVCAWRGYWIDAYKNGDVAAQKLGADGLARVATSDAMKKTDSWWPRFLDVARAEAKGDPVGPVLPGNTHFDDFYRLNCTTGTGK